MPQRSSPLVRLLPLLALLCGAAGGAHAARLEVTQPGWYEVPTADLSAGASFDALHLECQGRPVPLLVRDGRAGFVGVPRGWDGLAGRDRYGVANVYRTAPGPATALSVASGQGRTVARDAICAEHFEQDTTYGQFLFVPDRELFDHWLWAAASPGHPATLEVALKHRPWPGTQVLWSVAMRGRTALEADPDHHTIVKVAGQVLEDARWDGQAEHVAQGLLPAEKLDPAKVAVEVICPGDTDAKDVDSVAINTLRAEYHFAPAAPPAQELVYIEAGDGGTALALQGAADSLALALDVTDPGAPLLLPVTHDEAGSPVVQVVAPLTGRRQVLLVGKGAALRPTVTPDRAEPNLRELPPADYLAITDPSLDAALEPLLEHRRQEGLTVARVFAADIYDQYSYGLLSPDAIRAFVADFYGRAPADHKPRFLLLAGDANYDYRDVMKTGVKNLVPAMLLRADGFVETAMDAYYVALDAGSTREQMAVGRIPARTPAEMSAYVAKVLRYETAEDAPQQPWQSRLLMIADHDLTGLELGRYEDDLASTARAMRARGLVVDELYARTVLTKAELTAEQRRAAIRAKLTPAILDELRHGAVAVLYRGHGGEWGWSRDHALLIDDLKQLKSGDAAAVVLDTSCFTGWFDNPLRDPPWSLAEAMLFSDCPVVACVAPSRLGGLPIDEPILGALCADPQIRLGEAFRLGRQAVLYGNDKTWSLAFSYCLLGDPALKVPIKLPAKPTR